MGHMLQDIESSITQRVKHAFMAGSAHVLQDIETGITECGVLMCVWSKTQRQASLNVSCVATLTVSCLASLNMSCAASLNVSVSYIHTYMYIYIYMYVWLHTFKTVMCCITQCVKQHTSTARHECLQQHRWSQTQALTNSPERVKQKT